LTPALRKTTPSSRRTVAKLTPTRTDAGAGS
jgi:hypothetical protein